jgi:hypothetical protein
MRPVALAGISALVCAIAVVVLILGQQRTSRTGTNPGEVPNWVPGEPDRAIGMRYERPAVQPGISRETAIAAANTRNYAFPSAPGIRARYESMSFDNPLVWAAILPEKGLGHHKLFRDIPVWVISYEGVRIPPSHAGAHVPDRAMGQPPEPNQEMNVVVSAENGEVLGAFTYR